jgi:hypothetical protein
MQEKTKFIYSQSIESGIVRSNFSPFNLNILLLSVPKGKHDGGMKLLNNFYSYPGHVASMGWEKSIQSFGGEPRRKETPGRPRHRREDGIRMDLGETGRGCELDSTSSRKGQVASYRYISMDIYRYISIG